MDHTNPPPRLSPVVSHMSSCILSQLISLDLSIILPLVSATVFVNILLLEATLNYVLNLN